jgi:hypothetical protein
LNKNKINKNQLNNSPPIIIDKFLNKKTNLAIECASQVKNPVNDSKMANDDIIILDENYILNNGGDLNKPKESHVKMNCDIFDSEADPCYYDLEYSQASQELTKMTNAFDDSEFLEALELRSSKTDLCDQIYEINKSSTAKSNSSTQPNGIDQHLASEVNTVLNTGQRKSRIRSKSAAQSSQSTLKPRPLSVVKKELDSRKKKFVKDLERLDDIKNKQRAIQELIQHNRDNIEKLETELNFLQTIKKTNDDQSTKATNNVNKRSSDERPSYSKDKPRMGHTAYPWSREHDPSAKSNPECPNSTKTISTNPISSSKSKKTTQNAANLPNKRNATTTQPKVLPGQSSSLTSSANVINYHTMPNGQEHPKNVNNILLNGSLTAQSNSQSKPNKQFVTQRQSPNAQFVTINRFANKEDDVLELLIHKIHAFRDFANG